MSKWSTLWRSDRMIYLRLRAFMFFMFGPVALFLPYLPLYLQHYGFTPAEIGWLLTIGPVVAMLANPVWGFVSDRLQNVKLVLLILMLGSLAASQFLFHLRPFWAVFAAMMLFYFFNTSINPINTTQVFQTIENTPLRFGSFRIWGSLGYAVIVLAAGPVMEALGIWQLGWVYGAAMAVAILFALALHRPASPKGRSARRTITFRETIRSLLQGRFALFLAASLLIFIPNGVTALYLSLFIEELGGTASSIGWSMFAAAVLEVPLFLLLDRWSKPNARSMLNLLLFATVMYVVRWLLMGFATTPLHIVLIQCMHSLSFGFYIYTAAQLVEYLTERSFRASGQTMYALVQGALSMAIAGSLGGYLYERLGPHTLYLLCSGLTVIGFAVMFALRLSLTRTRGNQERDDGLASEG
ncbi:MFS transporter [Paenibacillus antri]|uniref:MFS transporter n=1 Tax=Paenibacillus antri TaxID=2582848 RepID=A0A5R9GLY4_9BACL|nr:MFS transporter [Paenibacillus antri]TLS52885.1 MFS transporter [Paenibacillus antri]